jgi:hypothetical protein
MASTNEPTEYIKHHKDGTVWAKGQVIGDVPTGYWEWFRKSGTIMRSGHFRDGIQVGEWTTYDRDGKVHKVTDMKDGPKGASGRRSRGTDRSSPGRGPDRPRHTSGRTAPLAPDSVATAPRPPPATPRDRRPRATPRGAFLPRFWPLLVLGLLGVVTLPLILLPTFETFGLTEEVTGLPLPLLVALSMINPTFLLVGAAAVGALLAPKVGLLSLVAERVAVGRPIGPDLRAALPSPSAWGSPSPRSPCSWTPPSSRSSPRSGGPRRRRWGRRAASGRSSRGSSTGESRRR